MSLREAVNGHLVPDAPEQEESDDEIVSALYRQLDVLEGTAVIIGNALTMLQLQIGNLRAEVKLFDTPTQQAPAQPDPPKTTPSGGVLEASLPEQERFPGFCGHENALLVDTRDGVQRVCPDCNE